MDLNISHDGYEKTRVHNIWNLGNSPRGNFDMIQTWKIHMSRWSQTTQPCKGSNQVSNELQKFLISLRLHQNLYSCIISILVEINKC